MKLKNVLILAFLIVTLIPIIIVSVLMYNSSFSLSKESYTRNLVESINVQADYISQNIENNMVSDYRFMNKTYSLKSSSDITPKEKDDGLLTLFQSYLEASEDKITACILLDNNNIPLYTVGEKYLLDNVVTQLPVISDLSEQIIMEFDLGKGIYSLGIVTPLWDNNQTYIGSMISIYDKSYIFKIISSYYEISDTFTYIIRANGNVVHSKGLVNENFDTCIENSISTLLLNSEGIIDSQTAHSPVLGYYKNIYNSPWYLVGFIDYAQIYAFINQFIWIYLIIIAVIIIADIILSFYFSGKVVAPINKLIKVIECYPESLHMNEPNDKNKGYFETQYLHTKFFRFMKTIMLSQHNFEGIYQLYQSNTMDDTNIDIDVKNQTIRSNKEAFEKLITKIDVPDTACIVEKFTNCFCEKDQSMLMSMLETMRDEHLSVASEADVFTPYLNQKWFHTLVVPMYEDDRLSRLFIQLRDISSFKKQELESFEQANKDALTGLYNRNGFLTYANKALLESTNLSIHGLLFIDMNSFKMVNDNFGHSAGDDLLCSVGAALLEAISPNDIASRFGGDEFTVFLANTSSSEMDAIIKALRNRLIFPYKTDKVSFTVSASIGSSIWNNSSSFTLEEMMKQADDNMYQLKRALKQKTDK